MVFYRGSTRSTEGTSLDSCHTHIPLLFRGSRRGLNVLQLLLYTLLVVLLTITLWSNSPFEIRWKNERAVVYNKPPKTGSSSITALLQTQLGNAERYSSFQVWSNNYLVGVNALHGTTLFVQHRHVDDRMIAKLSRNKEVVLVTSTRDPVERWLSYYREYSKADGAIETNWDGIEEWLEQKTGLELFEYHTGIDYYELYPNATKRFWIREARRIVKKYDIVLDLDHLDQSAFIAKKVLGVDLKKITRENVRAEVKSTPSPRIMEKIREISEREQILHKHMTHHLAVTYSTMSGTNCWKERRDDSSRCWNS